MRRCTKSASPATCLQKIATTFSLTTHLRRELDPTADSWRVNFLGIAEMPAVAAAKEGQMAQMVADVLVGVFEQIGVRQVFGPRCFLQTLADEHCNIVGAALLGEPAAQPS